MCILLFNTGQGPYSPFLSGCSISAGGGGKCACVLVCVYSPLLSGCSNSAGGGGKSSSSLLESGLVDTDIASLRSVTAMRKRQKPMLRPIHTNEVGIRMFCDKILKVRTYNSTK